MFRLLVIELFMESLSHNMNLKYCVTYTLVTNVSMDINGSNPIRLIFYFPMTWIAPEQRIKNWFPQQKNTQRYLQTHRPASLSNENWNMNCARIQIECRSKSETALKLIERFIVGDVERLVLSNINMIVKALRWNLLEIFTVYSIFAFNRLQPYQWKSILSILR